MALATAAITAALSSLSLHPPLHRGGLCLKPLCATLLPSSSSFRARTLPKLAATADIDTSFFDNVDPNDDIPFDPPAPPEGYVAPPSFDELPPESEEEVAAAYEEIYGAAYSGESVLGNDIYVMDGKVKKSSGLLGRKKRNHRDLDIVSTGHSFLKGGERRRRGERERERGNGNECGGRSRTAQGRDATIGSAAAGRLLQGQVRGPVQR